VNNAGEQERATCDLQTPAENARGGRRQQTRRSAKEREGPVEVDVGMHRKRSARQRATDARRQRRLIGEGFGGLVGHEW
jgi:hypothetical protein